VVPPSEYLEENLVVLALRSQSGNVALAAMELGLSRGELYTYIINHPDVAEAKRQIKESVKDMAEDLLVSGMKTDNTLLMFFLRTQAKDRGYGTDNRSTINNKVEVNVDARSLIAAMQKGTKLIDAKDENENDESEEGGIFPITEFFADRDGSGRTGEVLP